MTRSEFLRGIIIAMVMLAILAIPFSLSVSGQGTVTTRTVQLQTLSSYPIDGVKSGHCYHFEVAMGAAVPGDVLGGSVSSTGGSVTFAILNFDEGQQFIALTGTATCSWLDSHSRYFKEGQSFQFQWTVSSSSKPSDAYYVVLVNKNSAQIEVTMSSYRITT